MSDTVDTVDTSLARIAFVLRECAGRIAYLNGNDASVTEYRALADALAERTPKMTQELRYYVGVERKTGICVVLGIPDAAGSTVWHAVGDSFGVIYGPFESVESAETRAGKDNAALPTPPIPRP